MSFGDDMEVLAPQELRKVIENKILKMINHYKECK